MANAIMSGLRDVLTGRQVFGEPVRADGVTLITAARVAGGGGGGAGSEGLVRSGEGGGLGLVARPVGAYAIRDGSVRWVPAVDVNRLVLVAAVMVVGGLLVGLRIAHTRARAEERRAIAAGHREAGTDR